MAVVVRSLQPRLEVSRQSRRAFSLQGVNMLVVMAALVALMALATLAQTGRVATRGYQLAQLDQQHEALLRESERIHLRIAQARSLTRVEQRAREVLGMRPVATGQVRYLTIEVPALPAVAQGQR